jgi:hypothetical protein
MYIYEVLMTDCRLDGVQMYCDALEETTDKIIDFLDEKLDIFFRLNEEEEEEEEEIECVSI